MTICKDKEGKPKSFGFVCFKHKESVPYAIALLNGIRLYGRPIKVQYRFGMFSSLSDYVFVNFYAYFLMIVFECYNLLQI